MKEYIFLYFHTKMPSVVVLELKLFLLQFPTRKNCSNLGNRFTYLFGSVAIYFAKYRNVTYHKFVLPHKSLYQILFIVCEAFSSKYSKSVLSSTTNYNALLLHFGCFDIWYIQHYCRATVLRFLNFEQAILVDIK